MTKKKATKPKVKSIEYRAFSKHSSELHEALNDGVITSLAWKLFAVRIFSNSTVEIVTNPMLSAPEKATKLVGAMVKVIKTNEHELSSILDQCGKFLELIPVVERIQKEYKKLRNVCPGFKKEVIIKTPPKQRSCSTINTKILCSTIIVITIVSLIGLSYVKYTDAEFTIYEYIPDRIVSHLQYFNRNTEKIPKQIDFVGIELPLNVSWPLPSCPEPFVGRTKLIKQIHNNIFQTGSNIVGLFGPPAFGKSSLVIHFGHQLMNEKGLTVSYVDLGEFQLSFHQQLQFNVYTREMQVYDNCDNCEKVLKNSVNAANLLLWAASIDHVSVLILDNCDLVLNQWHDEFQNFLQELLKYSKEKLKIIITSQRRIAFANRFSAVEVTELTEKESLSLIHVLEPKLSNYQQSNIAQLVGNCPLAIKVAVVLLRAIGLNTLLSDLKTSGIDVLSSSSFPKQERFDVVMETACQYLDNTAKNAAFFFSLFPGSFDHNVLLSPTFKDFRENINILSERSLIERYTISPTQEVRYRFHKLIRKYFNHKLLTENSLKDIWRALFRKTFISYYTGRFFLYFTSNTISSLFQENQLFLATEQLNLRHLANMIMKLDRFSVEEKLVFVFAYIQGVVQKNHSSIVLDMVLNLVEESATTFKFSDICFFSDANMCKDAVYDLMRSEAVDTGTAYAYLSCNTWEKIALDKWIFITDASIQRLFKNSQMYCSQNYNTIIVKYLLYFVFLIFIWGSNFHNYKVLLRVFNGHDQCTSTHFWYYLTLPILVYLLMGYLPVTVVICSIPAIVLIICCRDISGNVFLMFVYLYLFYFNSLWLHLINIAISYLSLEGSGAIWLKSWCHLCILFTPTNSFWIVSAFNDVICVLIIPGIPILIVEMQSYFVTASFVRRFHNFLYTLKRNRT